MWIWLLPLRPLYLDSMSPGSVKSYANKKNVDIRLCRAIYELTDEMRSATEGLFEPVKEQIYIGAAYFRATFSSGSGHVAGCMVFEARVIKECGICLVRNGKTVHMGKIDFLRWVKEEVKEICPTTRLVVSLYPEAS